MLPALSLSMAEWQILLVSANRMASEDVWSERYGYTIEQEMALDTAADKIAQLLDEYELENHHD